MTATAEWARNRLVHELTGHGWLTEAWQAAFAAVPRHLFLPRFFRQTQTAAGTKRPTRTIQGRWS